MDGNNGGDGCHLHNTLITVTIVLCSLNVIVSIVRGNGSFMVSSIVSFYAMYLLFSGIEADPNRNTISMWMGFLMTSICFIILCSNACRFVTNIMFIPKLLL